MRNSTKISPPENPGLLDHCLLVLPETCVRQANLEPNLEDKGSSTRSLWLGRVWQLRALRAHLLAAREAASGGASLSDATRAALDETLAGINADESCARKYRALMLRWRRAAARRRSSLAFLELFDSANCNVRGVVIYMHGSGGMTYNNLRYARMMAADGFIVVAPDDMAGAFKLDSETSTRARKLHPLIDPRAPGVDTNYWLDDLVYAGKSEGRLSYCTKATTVEHDPDAARALYEEVFRLRAAELDFVLARLPPFVQRLGVFTMGTSEGAMTVARFDDTKYAQLGGALSVPTLQLIGSADEYFAGEGSVASEVASDPHSPFPNDRLRGHAFDTFKAQGLARGLVCVMDGAAHDATPTHDNFLRAVLGTFLAKPHQCHALDEIWAAGPYFAGLAVAEERHIAASQPPPPAAAAAKGKTGKTGLPPQPATGQSSRLLRVSAPAAATPEGFKPPTIANCYRQPEPSEHLTLRNAQAAVCARSCGGTSMRSGMAAHFESMAAAARPGGGGGAPLAADGSFPEKGDDPRDGAEKKRHGQPKKRKNSVLARFKLARAAPPAAS